MVKMEREGDLVCVECGLVKESRMMEAEEEEWGAIGAEKEGCVKECKDMKKKKYEGVEGGAEKIAGVLGRAPEELDRGVMRRTKELEGMRSERMLAAMVVCESKLGNMREVARAAGVSESGLRKGINEMQRARCKDL